MIDTKVKETVTLRTAHIVRMLAALHAAGQSHTDLIALTGLAADTMTRWLMELRRVAPDRVNLVHIEAWRRDSRGCWVIPVYRWNPGALDAERPPRKSAAQRHRDARDRKRREKGLPPIKRVRRVPIVTQWVGGNPFAAMGASHG